MNSRSLDELVSSGQIKRYTYENISDTNRAGDDASYEELTIKFNDGKTLTITAGSLSIE